MGLFISRYLKIECRRMLINGGIVVVTFMHYIKLSWVLGRYPVIKIEQFPRATLAPYLSKRYPDS